MDRAANRGVQAHDPQPYSDFRRASLALSVEPPVAADAAGLIAELEQPLVRHRRMGLQIHLRVGICSAAVLPGVA